MPQSLKESFSEVSDPRAANHRHLLIDILFLSVCAVISGAEGWESIEEFGKTKETWLRKFLSLPHGIPSSDCIARVFSRLCPDEFTRCFVAWVQHLSELSEGEIISIDGKTARRSYDSASHQGAIHVVSAWATQAGLALGQVKTDEKSNEITAIPALLELLEIRGCLITLDAMGCQKAIAQKIQEKQANYCLSLKRNQGQLFEAVSQYFSDWQDHQESSLFKEHVQQLEKTDAGHGRVEVRKWWLSYDLGTLPKPESWAGLKAIGMVQSERHQGNQVQTEKHYYLLSFQQLETFAKATRSHWGVENSLHWVLDVTFQEDQSRIRKEKAPTNFNILRKIVINLLKKEGSKTSLKKKRFKAALDDQFREKIVGIL